MEKENNSDETEFSEGEIPDLNSLKPFEFEPKANMGDINSSSSDDEEEGAEYEVKRISNNEWCECSAKAVFGRMLFKIGFRPATLLKRDSNTGVFYIFKNTFFTEHLYSDGCFWH